jgi:hypothetical protein
LSGGRAAGGSSVPDIYSSSYEPIVMYFGQMLPNPGYSNFYYLSSNTSLQGANGLSNIVFEGNYSRRATANNNMDAGLFDLSATLW